MGEQSAALVVNGRVNGPAVAAYAGEVRAMVEQMSVKLAQVDLLLSAVEEESPDDQEVSASVKASLRRLVAAVDAAGQALTAVSTPAASLAREAVL